MNIYILNVLNRVNLTQEQLKDNTAAADADADAAAHAHASAFVAAACFALAADYTTDDTEYCINEYLKLTGESRSDYEAELLRDNSFREVK